MFSVILRFVLANGRERAMAKVKAKSQTKWTYKQTKLMISLVLDYWLSSDGDGGGSKSLVASGDVNVEWQQQQHHR